MYTVTVYTILVEIMLQLISLRIVLDTVDTELYLICILKRSKLKIPSIFQNHHKKKKIKKIRQKKEFLLKSSIDKNYLQKMLPVKFQNRKKKL